MTEITWDEEARCELNCSALYLAKRGGKDLGERFLKQVEAAIAPAGTDPVRYRKFRKDARKVRVEHFPYHVVYWHDEASFSIHIVAIAHASREPEYWQERMSG
ncbi:MAG: type II toxin-antitoxin system RelE/ParE family toxin [Verrucomicrobia bacterium]|nr:type II toxin-antitoxin system RelE/ParE family toxin [Verrucomicrobiota bacterium]